MKRTELRRKTPLKRSAIKRGNAPSLRRTPLRKVNPKRQAKRLQAYRKVMASDFHKQLRYAAFLRSGGYCECQRCMTCRTALLNSKWTVGDVELACTPILVWFTKRGAEPWQRFRSQDGELHHVSYKHFGDENPDELRLVQWVWKDCHKRIEASQNTRRRYLATGK